MSGKMTWEEFFLEIHPTGTSIRAMRARGLVEEDDALALVMEETGQLLERCYLKKAQRRGTPRRGGG